jgi:hypothetical protein
MLKDTTSQHRAHLFDLNCKICTGKHNLGAETMEIRQNLVLFKIALLARQWWYTPLIPALGRQRQVDI